ncbi:hypothetical protein [Pseudoalteromonas sp. 1181_04]|uniref:hypothetical protein n=1 Tax=Pseudoalteromonas sp. 1181_04 TaxID=2604450 RepID=UPI004062F1D0
MKSLLNTVDILLGHFARGFTVVFLYIVISLIAVTSLLLIPFSFFEYDAGLSDLDLVELGLFILLIAAVWRFYNRCFNLKWTKWRAIKRFVFVVAFAELLYMFFYAVYLIIELADQGVLGVEILDRHADFESFLSSLVIIAAIYAGTPLPPFYLNKEKQPKEEAGDTFSDGTSEKSESASLVG